MLYCRGPARAGDARVDLVYGRARARGAAVRHAGDRRGRLAAAHDVQEVRASRAGRGAADRLVLARGARARPRAALAPLAVRDRHLSRARRRLHRAHRYVFLCTLIYLLLILQSLSFINSYFHFARLLCAYRQQRPPAFLH